MSGETLFRRVCSVIVAAPVSNEPQSISANVTKIEGLRVSFEITKTITKDPNTAKIKIYNLNQTTRSALGGKGSKVILSAGYVDTLAQIFIGDVSIIETVKLGADWVTTIECGDGARAMKHARVSDSFAGGTSQAQALRKIASIAKVDIGNIDSVAGSLSGQFSQGYSAHGIAFVELEKLLKQAGYTLSIQDGALLAVNDTSTSTETTIVLNASSGLIGSPEMGSGDKKAGSPILKAKSLLQPDIKPGRRVRVESLQYKGDFRAEKVQHTGDTHGVDWFSLMELKAL